MIVANTRAELKAARDKLAGPVVLVPTMGALPAYLALARLTADRALAAGRLSAGDAERLLDVLGDHR